jgi:tRNA-2-methylthio-N6-dimethylallyladenosine synthase
LDNGFDACGAGQYQDIEELLVGHFGLRRTAYVHSFGCQQNEADAQKLAGLCVKMGFELGPEIDSANLIILNTCAVRESAQNRALGWIGSLKGQKQRNPNTIIAVFGCMSQLSDIAERLRSSYPYVDIIAGAGLMHLLPVLLQKRLREGKTVVDVTKQASITESVIEHNKNPYKAWLPIMKGCDNFCSYCIVPYVRGRESSREKQLVLKDAARYLSGGCKEITLLGQNVNSYGKGLKDGGDFPGLLGELDAMDGDWWLRFMTSHPKDFGKRLVDTIAGSRHICRHIHLPVQSGSDRVLKAMNRGYTTREYLKLIDYARSRIDGVSFSSDVMVGFPGESRKDFEKTLALVSKVGFNAVYMFIYSPRAKTAACKLDDPVTKQEKSAWFRELVSLQQSISEEQNRALVGRRLKVLVEGKSKKREGLVGRTQGDIIVEFCAESDEDLTGQFTDVQIEHAGNASVSGRRIARANT